MSGAEVWDVTDASGAPTGRTHVRGAPGWPRGFFHIVAATCVVDARGRLLLTRRGPTKDFAGGWEFPGGSALTGESSVQAAVRELFEEIGVSLSIDALRWVERFEEDTVLFDLYLADLPADQVPRPDGLEVSELEWVELSEVARRKFDRELATPWQDRLHAFWGPLTAAIAARDRSR